MGNESINKNIDKFLKLKLYFSLWLQLGWFTSVIVTFQNVFLHQPVFLLHAPVSSGTVRNSEEGVPLAAWLFHFFFCGANYDILFYGKKKLMKAMIPKKRLFFYLAPDKSSDWFRRQYFQAGCLLGEVEIFQIFFLHRFPVTFKC